MSNYRRIFGSGPRGAFFGTVLFVLAILLKEPLGLPQVSDNDLFRYLVFALFTALTFFIIGWSLVSLPPKERGRGLVTSGAFRYFRHPLYAAFLSFFNFGFAVLLNNWIYIAWAAVLIPIWHLNVKSEEAFMLEIFGEEYAVYCSRTGRFFPRLPGGVKPVQQDRD